MWKKNVTHKTHRHALCEPPLWQVFGTVQDSGVGISLQIASVSFYMVEDRCSQYLQHSNPGKNKYINAT